MYDSATARGGGITLIDSRSASARSAGNAGNSEFDEESGLYTLHEASFFWLNRPKNMSAEYHRPLTVQELRDFVLDPRLNLPTSVAHLTSILEYYKSISVTLAGPNHAAPSVYPSDNAEGTSVKITLGSQGVFEGPDLEVKCGDVCTAEDGCTGHIGDLVLEPGIADGTVIVYSLVGAFACKAYARQCASCKTWYKFTGHGTGMLRLTKQTAFSLDLFLEHTERTRSSLGSQTFTQFGNSVSRAYAWSGLVPDAFERVPGTIHKFGQTSAFIDFWLTVCSASQFHYPTAVPCPAHGQGGCEEFVADGTALGPPQRLLSGARSLHAPAEPVLRGDVVIKDFVSRRFNRSILPNQWPHDDPRANSAMGKADALVRRNFRTAGTQTSAGRRLVILFKMAWFHLGGNVNVHPRLRKPYTNTFSAWSRS